MNKDRSVFTKSFRLMPSLLLLSMIGMVFAYAIGARGDQISAVAVVPGIVVFLWSRVFLWVQPMSDAEVAAYKENQKGIRLPTRMFVTFTALCIIGVGVASASSVFYAVMNLRYAAVAAAEFALGGVVAIPLVGFVMFLCSAVRNYYPEWSRTALVPTLKPMLACAMVSIFMLPTMVADHAASHWAHKA